MAATDTDNDTLTYTLSGTDAAAFSLVSSTGQLQTKAALDYETKPSYSVTVSVSDGNGGTDSITVTINVTDVNETPANNAPVTEVVETPSNNAPVTEVVETPSNSDVVETPSNNVTEVVETPSNNITVPANAGDIIISEIMFESSGGLHSLPQWIELYNTTDRNISLRGWQFIWYRREPKLLDVTTTFETDFVIPAKQARLIVSKTSRNSGEPQLDHGSGAVYSLLSHHSAVLDQKDGTNRNRLISRGGFYLKLLADTDTPIDHISTVADKASEPTWELPDCDIEGVRSSLIRRFDEAGKAKPGTQRDGWIRAYDTRAQSTRFWYGRNTDIGTPAYRSEDKPLPVNLSVFSARTVSDKVVLKWTTESEVDNAGFNILRSTSKKVRFVRVNPKLILGAGTTGERTEYTWTDTTAKSNTFYYYRIEDMSHAGVREQLATVQLRGLFSAHGKLITKWSNLKRTPAF